MIDFDILEYIRNTINRNNARKERETIKNSRDADLS